MSREGLPHILTQNRKSSVEQTEHNCPNKRLFLHQTHLETTKKVPAASLTATHNPEVADSNPVPATMIKPRFIRI